MRISEAAQQLGTSPRMLRYRERLGLLPPVRTAPRQGTHRRFTEPELRAVALGLALEQRYGVGPAELAFGLRVLAEPEVRARLRELGERIGRLAPPAERALDWEKQRAMRWLGRPPATAPAPRTVPAAPAASAGPGVRRAFQDLSRSSRPPRAAARPGS